jgi:hypothetical protein
MAEDGSKDKKILTVVETVNDSLKNRAFRNALRNFTEEWGFDESGKKKLFKIPIDASEVWRDLKNLTGNRIKRIKNRVFANGEGKILYFDRPEQLIGWCAAHGAAFEWANQVGMITKSEFLHYLSNIVDQYEFATALPHYPKVEGFYYINDIAPKETGRLDELIKFFKPSTDHDKAILKSAILTPFWGGSFGSRPAFLIDGQPNDQEGNRGIGKTAVTDTISYLCNGHVDLSTKTEGPDIRKMLLTSGDLRIVRFDNIKQNTLSSDTIESLITAQNVSGHRMYLGHDSIPNWFGYYLTFNDAMLSKDMSQRCMIIRLDRPVYDPEWWTNIVAFIDKYHDEIIGDIGTLLLKDNKKFFPKSRFTLWERNVLAKCSSNIAELQDHITNDQSAVDDTKMLTEDLTEMIMEKLAVCSKMDPLKTTIAVKRSWVTCWVQEFLGKNYSKKSALKVLERTLPTAFLLDTKMHCGVHYLVWSGANFVTKDRRFLPTSAWRIDRNGDHYGKIEWKFQVGASDLALKYDDTLSDAPDPIPF